MNLFLENINIEFKINKKKKNIQHKTLDDLTRNELKSVEDKYDEYEDFLIMNFNKKYTIIPFKKNPKYLKEYKKTFIDSSKPTNIHLTSLYSSIQDLGKQDKFLKYLQIIDKNITRIEPQVRGEEQSFLRVTLENPKQSLISSELGEGTNRFIEILCTLLSNANGTVLIDEIENGIHYTKLYDIWKAIIEIVQKENIQLFVTTHDLESIEALNRASEDMQFNKISSITLERDVKNIIYPIIRKYSSFNSTVDSGMDIR
jgi:AAA15 family ATPase/GTPase